MNAFSGKPLTNVFAGSRPMTIRDEARGISFPALALYPTETPSTPTLFGPYKFDVSPGAPCAEGRFPLVVISHGNGGSHLLYRTVGLHLARNGYVVVSLEHPGNNRNDNSLEGSLENLIRRPRHVRLTIDAVLADPEIGAHVQGDNVAILGHSMGTYTALAVAGGTPWTQTGERVEVEPDPRVRALVLLAPAAGWYIPPGALKNVEVPILMLVAEHDPVTPRWNAEVVMNGVPDRSRITCRIVESAGHFSFLSPFPPHMKNPAFRPSTDPEGFDREKLHEHLPGEVLEFLDSRVKGL